MKKYLLFILPLVAMTFASCDDKGGGGEAKKYALEVDAETLTFTGAAAAAQTVNVEAENVEWSVEANATAVKWLHLEKTDTGVTVTVDDNPGIYERTAKFTVKSNTTGIDSKEITVTQTGVSLSLVVSPLELSFEEPGTRSVTVTSNAPWKVVLPRSAGDWITIQKSAEGFSVTVAANANFDTREAALAITVDDVEEESVAVSQTSDLIPMSEVFTFGYATYWGDGYHVGFGNYCLSLLSTNVNDAGYIIPGKAGIKFVLDMVADVREKTVPAELNTGTYKIALSPREDNSSFTAYADYSFLEMRGADGKKIGSDRKVLSGTYTVGKEGDNYTIEMKLVVEDRGDLNVEGDSTFYGFEATFTGPIKITNPANKEW